MAAKRIANSLLWLLALLPVLAGLAMSSVQDWRGSAACLNTLGRLSGIGGLSFLLVAAILSCRVPGFDRIFGGLTKLWQTHHKLGAAAFLCLLAHPLLLAFAAAETSLAAAMVLLFPPFKQWVLWLGWPALLLMMVFLAPSFAFFGEPRYQRWKYLHRLAGLTIVFASIHALFLNRMLPQPWAAVLWGVLICLAGAAMGYRFAFSRWAGRLYYDVAKVVARANNVVEIELSPRTRHLKYQAGQFVYLRPYDKKLQNGYAQEHPYTLSSAPHESHLRITIKDLGNASRAIQSIETGSEVCVEGPYGAFFSQVRQDVCELWIAGGIGITPFISRIRELSRTAAKANIHLIYCVQDEPRLLFADELSGYAQELPGFVFTPHYFYQQGRLNKDFLMTHCPDYRQRDIYLCGPPGMLQHVGKLLTTAGVPRKYIHTEEFNLL